MDIDGRTALVTGAGSGIGRAIALRLARERARVLAADRNGGSAAQTARMIAELGGEAAAVAIDVTDDAAVQRMMESAAQRFGGPDILVNNAGIATGTPPFPHTPSEKQARAIAVNLTAVIRCTQLAIPLMVARGGGVIVNIASLAGINGFALDPVYAATKGAVVMFTRSLAGLFETSNIRVAAICPGAVDTEIWRSAEDPRLRALIDQIPYLAPDEIADATVAIIRDESAAGKALQVAAGRAAEFMP